MLIELTIRRRRVYPGGRKTVGTNISLENPEHTYYFGPKSGDPDDPHTCEVTNPQHIKTLLAIPEYQVVVDAGEKEVPAEPKVEINFQPPPEMTIARSDKLRATLMDTSVDDLVEKYGKGSTYKLKIDRRMGRTRIVDTIMKDAVLEA